MSRCLTAMASRCARTCASFPGTTFGYEQSLMTHIRRIREKIELNPSKPESLITMKGLGYKLLVKEQA